MLPNFLIVGTAKAGTRSLVEGLKQHPAVAMAARKEPHYFARGAISQPYTGPGDLSRAFRDRGGPALVLERPGYESLFTAVRSEAAVGEASVFYLYDHEAAVPAIQADLGDPKIVMILRDPVRRAYSAYQHLRGDGREELGFYEALEHEEERRRAGYAPLWYYRNLGYYSAQVEHFLDAFTHVLILWYEDLQRDTGAVVRQVYRFLEVDSAFAPRGLGIRYNATGAPVNRSLYRFVVEPNGVKNAVKPVVDAVLPLSVQRLWHAQVAQWMVRPGRPPDPRAVALLRDAYAADIGRVARLTGRNLSPWLTRT